MLMERVGLACGSVREQAFGIPRTPNQTLSMKTLDIYSFISPDINPCIKLRVVDDSLGAHGSD